MRTSNAIENKASRKRLRRKIPGEGKHIPDIDNLTTGSSTLSRVTLDNKALELLERVARHFGCVTDKNAASVRALMQKVAYGELDIIPNDDDNPHPEGYWGA